MPYELGIVDFDDLSRFSVPFDSQSSPRSLNLYDVILSQENGLHPFTRNAVLHTNLSAIEGKTKTVFQREVMKPLKAGGSAEVGGKVEWGGKDGTKGSGYVKGEVHDDNGNYAEAEVEQKTDGSGSATVKAGHEEN